MGELEHIGDLVWVELEKLEHEDKLPRDEMEQLIREREAEIERRKRAWRRP